MNERMKEILEEAEVIFDNPHAHVPLALVSMEDFKLITELIVKECASKVDWILAEGGKTQGDLIREHFEIPVSSIEAAENLHSDKGYSLGTPEAQEAFERKRGYKL
jgi:hypothetical protein